MLPSRRTRCRPEVEFQVLYIYVTMDIPMKIARVMVIHTVGKFGGRVMIMLSHPDVSIDLRPSETTSSHEEVHLMFIPDFDGTPQHPVAWVCALPRSHQRQNNQMTLVTAST